MIGNGGGDGGGGGGGGSVKTYRYISLNPGGLDQPDTDYASLIPVVGTNQELQAYLFDNVTAKSLELQESITDLDATRDIIFNFYITSLSSIASENAKIRIKSSGAANGEDFDIALATNDSIDFEINGTAKYITRYSFTKTVAELGITNLDLMKLTLSFIAASVNPYSAGLYTVGGEIGLPVEYNVS